MKSVFYLALIATVAVLLTLTGCKSKELNCDITKLLARGGARAEAPARSIVFRYSQGRWLPESQLRAQVLADPGRHLPATGVLSFHSSVDGASLGETTADGPAYLEALAFASASEVSAADRARVLEGATFTMRIPGNIPPAARFLRWKAKQEWGALEEAPLWIDLESLPVSGVVASGTGYVTPEGIESDLPIESIHYSGDPRRRLNLMILPDGYTASQLEKFRADSSAMVAKLFTFSPYKDYKDLINVMRLNVASRAEGADCDDGRFSPRKNRYGSSFPVACLNSMLHTHLNDRFIVQLNAARVSEDSRRVFYKGVSIVDETYVLVHSPKYGGASVIWGTQTDVTPWDTASHEMGHSWGRLADEYLVPGDMCHIYMALSVNMSFKKSEAKDVKWKEWILDETPLPTPDQAKFQDVVGLFQGGAGNCKKILYRPMRTCKMVSSSGNFCPVCMEQMILRIFERARPIQGELIRVGKVIHAPVALGEQLRTRWYLDDSIAQESADYQPLTAVRDPVGHKVRLEVFDDTAPVRRNRCDLVFATEATF